jgi:hypothetical protein
MILKSILILSIGALTASAAAASDSPNKTSRNDPNRMVCRTISDSGNKLKRERACHTVAEWRELRRQTQQTIEHIQNSRAANGG